MGNVNYVVFSLATGEPLRWGICPAEMVAAQAGEGERSLPTTALTVDGNRMAVWEAAKAQRDAHIDGGAATPYGVADSDDLARSNVSGAALAALIAKNGGDPFSITWTMADNSTVPLDADGMIALGVAVMAHVDACHAHARALRAAIESAPDMAALLAIDVAAGWPA